MKIKLCNATTKAGNPCKCWAGLSGKCPGHNGRNRRMGGETMEQRKAKRGQR